VALTKTERKEIKALIKDGRNEDYTGKEIAKELNGEGYTTEYGKPWSEATVSSFALKNGMGRKKNTIAGAAGTTGIKHRPSVKQRKKNKKKVIAVALPSQTSFKMDDFDVLQDVFNSDMEESSKRILVNKLTGSAG
jgi:hypothetical protein